MTTERNPSQTSSSSCPGQRSVRLRPPNLSRPLPPVTTVTAPPPATPLSQGRRRPRRSVGTPQVEFEFSGRSRRYRAPQTHRLPIDQDVFADVPKGYPLPLWRSRLMGFGGGLLETASVLLMTITFGLGWAAFEIETEFVRASQHLPANSPNQIDEAATLRISRGKNGPFLTFDDATSVGGRGSGYDPGTTDDGAPSPWTRAEPSSGTAQSSESNSAQAPPSSKP